ncbi:MAG: HAD family hydrolase [Spirochaetota bacterium]
MGTFETEQIGVFIAHSSPLEPVPPDLPPDLHALVGLRLPRVPRAVLFDIYGTLVVSGSGEVGSAVDEPSRGEPSLRDATGPFVRAFEIASGASLPAAAEETARRTYHAAVAASHRASRDDGVSHPEVDITRIWRTVLDELARAGLEPAPVDVEMLAIAYETVSNPAWPMPGARRLLARLRQSAIALGIVSNAQFYTPRMLRALFGATPAQLGFDPKLIAYSYLAGRAKPDATLFDAPLAELQRRGIDSQRVAYVGNDMRNDIAPARSKGCMTVLFAGDRRSLRLRRDTSELDALHPDAVVTSLDAVAAVCGLDHGCGAAIRQGE